MAVPQLTATTGLGSENIAKARNQSETTGSLKYQTDSPLSLTKTVHLPGKIFHLMRMKIGQKANPNMRMTRIALEHMNEMTNHLLVPMENLHGMMSIVKIMQNLFVSSTYKIIISRQINGSQQDNRQQLAVKEDGKSMLVDAMLYLETKIVIQITIQK